MLSDQDRARIKKWLQDIRNAADNVFHLTDAVGGEISSKGAAMDEEIREIIEDFEAEVIGETE